MIDTDKYEGHTPAPWVVNNPDDYETSLIFSVGALKFVSSANTQLIMDAPLLLAEVKRLREDNELYLDCIHASHFRDKPGSAMSKLNQMRFLQRGEDE